MKKFNWKLLPILAIFLYAFYHFLRGYWDFPVQVSLGLVSIKLYSVFILLGVGVACYGIGQEVEGQKFAKKLDISEAAIWVVIPGIILGRAWHVMTDWHLYADKPITALNITAGGMGIFGAMIGALIGIFVYTKIRGLPFLLSAEYIALFMPLGHVIGRFGNFANQELYGPVTNLPWGQYIKATGRYHHPAFLYEQIGNLALFTLLYTFYKKNGIKGDGVVGYLYLIGYGILRICVDIFRQEPRSVFGVLTPGQFACAIMITLGCAMLLVQKKLLVPR